MMKIVTQAIAHFFPRHVYRAEGLSAEGNEQLKIIESFHRVLIPYDLTLPHRPKNCKNHQ